MPIFFVVQVDALCAEVFGKVHNVLIGVALRRDELCLPRDEDGKAGLRVSPHVSRNELRVPNRRVSATSIRRDVGHSLLPGRRPGWLRENTEVTESLIRIRRLARVAEIIRRTCIVDTPSAILLDFPIVLRAHE